jgi:hypothetical protein
MSEDSAMRPITYATLLAAGLVSVTGAQNTAGFELALMELLAVRNLECTFSAGGAGSWEDGQPAAATTAEVVGPIRYLAIDLKTSTARQGDPDIAGEVRLIPTSRGLHLYEFDSDGNLSITTVSITVDEESRNLAVLSRHTGTVGNLEPTQLYGFCRALSDPDL